MVDEKAEEYNEANDWEWEDYWPEEGEKVNPNFSLGEIGKVYANCPSRITLIHLSVVPRHSYWTSNSGHL